ncbi:sodium:solute symporter family protein [Halomarina rubra]|uniref:Sodium:solute symporter family protein n=1 Tax=Halomarina rubra TaxID=2071873 RepID=A0ABD6AXS6_9EURY|nr:sodium:solute symporter family protein [Halomarina rubra]
MVSLVEGVFFGTLVVYVFVGAVLARFIDVPEDFYVMDRKAGSILIAGTLFASYMSASTMMGIAGIVYTEGAAMWLVIYGSWPGLVIGMLYVGRRLRKLNNVTMPDFIGDRYQSELVRSVATVIMIVGLIGYGVIQLIGAGYLLADFVGIPYQQIVVLFAIALMVFTVAGGMYSVVVTDTLMGVAMIVTGAVVAPAAIFAAGGIEVLTTTLPQQNPGVWYAGGANMNMSPGWLASQWVLWLFFIMVAPWVVSRAFPASDDFELMNGTNISTFLATGVITVLFLGVMATYALNSGIEPVDNVVVWMSTNVVHPFWGGLAVAGIMAGILSTTSTIFIYAGFGLSRDLVERVGGQTLTQRQQLLGARLAQFAVVVVVTVIALFEPLGIYWLAAWAGSVFAVAWAPMIIAGLEWERANKYGALASMIGGTAAYVLLYQATQAWGMFSLPFGIDPVLPALLISTVLMVGGSLATSTSRDERAFFDEMNDVRLSEEVIERHTQTELKKKYDRTRYIAYGTLGVGTLLFGGLFIAIGMPLL